MTTRALVTGAAVGIGRAVAQRLASDGLDLVLLDRNESPLRETAEKIATGAGSPPEVVILDVTDTERLQDTVRDLDDRKPFDGLVNVAGIGLMSTLPELSLDQWQRTLDVNLTAPFVLGRLLGLRMADRGAGSIVNISSIAGKTGSAELPDYCASKAGLISLTQSLSKALGPQGVRVNAVCPGLIWTPMWNATATWIANRAAQDGPPAEPRAVFEAAVQAMTPLKRETRPEDIAAMVSFLLGDDSQLVTGQAINVDGGIEVH